MLLLNAQHMLDVLVQLAALAAPYICCSDQKIFGRRRLCRAPVACFGSVFVHVAAVIAACIVCSVLFVFVSVMIR